MVKQRVLRRYTKKSGHQGHVNPRGNHDAIKAQIIKRIFGTQYFLGTDTDDDEAKSGSESEHEVNARQCQDDTNTVCRKSKEGPTDKGSFPGQYTEDEVRVLTEFGIVNCHVVLERVTVDIDVDGPGYQEDRDAHLLRQFGIRDCKVVLEKLPINSSSSRARSSVAAISMLTAWKKVVQPHSPLKLKVSNLNHSKADPGHSVSHDGHALLKKKYKSLQIKYSNMELDMFMNKPIVGSAIIGKYVPDPSYSYASWQFEASSSPMDLRQEYKELKIKYEQLKRRRYGVYYHMLYATHTHHEDREWTT